MKISVITICLNSAAYLEKTLYSVISQDYEDFECLVVDGGSSDGSVALIAEVAAKDDRVIWWSAPDNGISHAMNLGLTRACGDVIAFLHADDFYPNTSVLSYVANQFISTPELQWLTGGIHEVDKAGQLIRTLPVRHISKRRLLRNNILFHPATFVRRDFLLSVGGFDESLHYVMDYDLWLRLIEFSSPLTVKYSLASFRVHDGSRSTTQRLAVLDEEYEVSKQCIHGALQRYFHAFWQKWRRAYEIWRGAEN